MENNARFFNAKKPKAEVDLSLGIARKAPVCPNCDSYLTQMLIFGGDGDKVGWCECCGQKIDWSEWEEANDT